MRPDGVLTLCFDSGLFDAIECTSLFLRPLTFLHRFVIGRRSRSSRKPARLKLLLLRRCKTDNPCSLLRRRYRTYPGHKPPEGDADAIAFGRYFVSNPDLPRRIREGLRRARPNLYQRW